MIIRNSLICLLCNTEIESKHVHDWVDCTCGACFVDGGREYIRRGGDSSNMKDTSIVESVKDNKSV